MTSTDVAGTVDLETVVAHLADYVVGIGEAVQTLAAQQERLACEVAALTGQLRARGPAGQDIEAERQAMALRTTAEFVDAELSHLTGVGGTPVAAKLTILRQAALAAPDHGLTVEFGVATGSTLREIVAVRGAAHGFDSFEGLPEHWRSGFGAGRFAQAVPDVPGAQLHVGWFQDSLPGFLAAHREPFAFVHMDADLYSSTACVFDLAADRFVPGTVIVFDEYFNYPGWQHHEHRAFREFLDRSGLGFEYLAYSAVHEQVAVRLLAREA